MHIPLTGTADSSSGPDYSIHTPVVVVVFMKTIYPHSAGQELPGKTPRSDFPESSGVKLLELIASSRSPDPGPSPTWGCCSDAAVQLHRNRKVCP